MFNKLFASGLVASALLSAGTAQAFTTTFSTPGVDNFTAVYQYNIDGATIDAWVKYTLTGLTGSAATFRIDMANNSSGAGQNLLTAFGIDVITPAITGVSDNTNNWGETLNVNFPGFHNVDFCAWAGTNCSGGAGNGLGEGGTDSFLVTLDGTFNGSITFGSPFPAKFQAVGASGKSYELDVCQVGGTCGPPTEIPEPGSLALLGIAALGAGIARRRRVQ